MAHDPTHNAPPALPTPSQEYDAAWQRQFNNVLRLYFNQLTELIGDGLSGDNIEVSGYNSASDAFGRFRVSNPVTVFDSKQIFDSQPLYWDDQEETGSGTTSTHSVDNARTRLAVTNTTAGLRTRQTFERFNYQPGKSQLIYLTAKMGVGESGITQRIGYGDDNNGLFFECVDGVMGINVRTSTSGSPIDGFVAQTAWNVDKLDGNGVSGLTADWDNTLIFTIDFEWLGVGTVRFGVIVDAIVYYVHQVDNSNALTTVYMSTPNLPLRYQIENDGTGGTYELDHICSTVITEGGTGHEGLVRSATTGGAAVTCSTEDVAYALIGIRLKAANIGESIEMLELALQIQNATKQGEWQLLLNPTVAGTFTYAGETNSSVEIARGATANTVTLGTLMEAGYAFSSGSPGGGSGEHRDFSSNRRHLGAAIDGTVDEIVLTFIPRGGTTSADVEALMSWQEL